MHHVYDRPLQFSDCHGCNVIVESSRTLAEATYLKAHGQFITTGYLRRDQRYDLVFQGKGIVKFSAFPQRSQAVDWVRSKQPLPRGCRRVRFKGIVHYAVNVPNPGRCVLVESVRQSGREMFTFEAGPTTTLCFDIEYGDIMVHIDSSLTFDKFCHSPHIKLCRGHNRTTASLVHFNPSSLCCLEDAPLIPGVIFRLEVQNSSHKTDSGSYIRMCVARQLSQYENNDHTLSYGSPTHPCLTGRRRLIAHNSCEDFIVQILQGGLLMSRPNSPNIETMHFQLDKQRDQTLWFEIHKVSLRVWQVRERDTVDLDHAYITFELDLDDPPPSAPAPPPPRLSLRKPAPPTPPRLSLRKPAPPPPPRLSLRKPAPTPPPRLSLQKPAPPPPPRLSLRKLEPPPLPPRVPLRNPTLCRRGADRQTNRAYGKPHRGSVLAAIHNGGYMSDASVACASNHSTLDSQHGSHVSTDNFRSFDRQDCDTSRTFTTVPISLTLNSAMRHHLLCHNYIDSTPLPSIGPNVITLSSLKSLNVNNDNYNSNSQHIKNIRNNPLYEQSSHILEMSKPTTRTPFLHGKDSREKTSLSPTTKIIKTPWLPSNGSEECQYHANKSHPVNHNQSSDNHADTSADNGFVTVIPQYRGRHSTSTANSQLSDLDRKLMCELWVAKVNDNQHIWPSQKDFDIIKSQDCGSCQEYHGRHRCGPANAICQNEINRRLGDSEVPTSSVWLSGLDDGPESIQHNLDIHIVPVHGQLKCHSYYSDSIHTLAGSRSCFNNTTNTLTNPYPDLTETTNGFADIRKSTHNQRRRQLPVSSENMSYFCGKDMNSNRQETTLNKTFCCSTETLCGSGSTFVNPETCTKSVNSDGFDVDDGNAHNIFKDCIEPSDEITHLKHLAKLSNLGITHDDRHLEELDLTDKASNKSLPPKPCSQKPFSQYCLAVPQSPTSITSVAGLPRSPMESDRAHVQQAFSDYNQRYYNDANLAESSQEASIITNNRRYRGNELCEQATDRNCGVTYAHHQRRRARPKIVDSIISNSDDAYLSIGKTIKLPAGIQPKRTSESTEDQRKNLESASTLLFSNVSDTYMNTNSPETTLKKTFCCSTEFDCGSDSTVGNHEIRPKSNNSDGFTVCEGNAHNMSEDCIDPSDEITHLKHLARLDSFGITWGDRQLQEFELTNKTGKKSLPPKSCSQQPISQYCLAGRLSPPPITTRVPGLPRSPQDSDRNQAQQTYSVYNETYEKTSTDVAESSQTTLSITSNRDNELNEQAIGTNSADICMRNRSRSSQRNIVESVISNSAAGCSSIEPTTQLPNGIQPKERSETLERNLDCSLLNKNCK